MLTTQYVDLFDALYDKYRIKIKEVTPLTIETTIDDPRHTLCLYSDTSCLPMLESLEYYMNLQIDWNVKFEENSLLISSYVEGITYDFAKTLYKRKELVYKGNVFSDEISVLKSLIDSIVSNNKMLFSSVVHNHIVTLQRDVDALANLIKDNSNNTFNSIPLELHYVNELKSIKKQYKRKEEEVKLLNYNTTTLKECIADLNLEIEKLSDYKIKYNKLASDCELLQEKIKALESELKTLRTSENSSNEIRSFVNDAGLTSLFDNPQSTTVDMLSSYLPVMKADTLIEYRHLLYLKEINEAHYIKGILPFLRVVNNPKPNSIYTIVLDKNTIYTRSIYSEFHLEFNNPDYSDIFITDSLSSNSYSSLPLKEFDTVIVIDRLGYEKNLFQRVTKILYLVDNKSVITSCGLPAKDCIMFASYGLYDANDYFYLVPTVDFSQTSKTFYLKDKSITDSNNGKCLMPLYTKISNLIKEW